MGGKLPQTILTDFDSVLREIVMNELPNIKHAFGIWYISQRLSCWFSTLLSSQYNSFMNAFHQVYNLETETDFMHQWDHMVNEFGLASDRHIAILSHYQSYWALPFLRGWFLGSLSTGSSASSIKSFFKAFLNAQARLKDFVDQVLQYHLSLHSRSSFHHCAIFENSDNTMLFCRLELQSKC